CCDRIVLSFTPAGLSPALRSTGPYRSITFSGPTRGFNGDVMVTPAGCSLLEVDSEAPTRYNPSSSASNCSAEKNSGVAGPKHIDNSTLAHRYRRRDVLTGGRKPLAV